MSSGDIQLRGVEPYTMAFYPFADSRESQQTFTGKLVEHHGNGQLKSETVYVDGLKEGLSRAWSDEGELLVESNWSKGQRHGKQLILYINGDPRIEENYIEGRREGIYSYWQYEGGLYREINYSNGMREGRARSWNIYGVLVIAHYENDVVTTCEVNNRINGECEVNPERIQLF